MAYSETQVLDWFNDAVQSGELEEMNINHTSDEAACVGGSCYCIDEWLELQDIRMMDDDLPQYQLIGGVMVA